MSLIQDPLFLSLGALIVAMLLVVLYWATRRPMAKEPDSQPPFVPSREEQEIMLHQDISYLDWLDMHNADRTAARNAFYRSKGL